MTGGKGRGAVRGRDKEALRMAHLCRTNFLVYKNRLRMQSM
jgi:hypothetical protein